MIAVSNNFTSIQNRIQSLQNQPSTPRLISYFWPRDPLDSLTKTLQQLTQELKNKISDSVDHARSAQDQKIKYAVCENLLQFNHFLEAEKERGSLKALVEIHRNAPNFKTLQACIAQMSAVVHNGLIRGNDRQDVWGTRFCYEEAFSSEHWEQKMVESRNLPQEKVSLYKYYALYIASLIWTQFLSIVTPRHWWDKITTTGPHQAGLYLGALPLSTPFYSDLNRLKKEGIGAVLSMVEPFENHSKGAITSPITSLEWEQSGIKQLQIPMEDFGTGPVEDVEKGVEFIRWNVLNKRSVYIHCKAGRGRSALVLMAYLIKYEHLSAKQAFDLVRSQRYQAGFKESESKMKTLLEYEKRVKLS